MGQSAPKFNEESRDGPLGGRWSRSTGVGLVLPSMRLLSMLLLSMLLLASRPAGAAVYQYTVRYFEKDVGRLIVTEGAPKGDLTPVKVKGRLVVPGSNLDMVVAAKSLRTADMLSAKIDMRFAIFGAPRVIHGKIDGNHFKGTFRDGDQPEQTLGERAETGIGDLMTIGYFLGHQPAAATTVKTAAFGGFFVYAVDAVGGQIETIALPVGPRTARRWDLVARRPGKERKVTVWTDVKREIPLMAQIDLDFLGPVTVVLSTQR